MYPVARGMSPPTVAIAALTGLSIAAYTVIDGVGVRRAGSPVGYTAWLFTVSGLMMPIALFIARPRARLHARVEPALLLRGAVMLALG